MLRRPTPNAADFLQSLDPRSKLISILAIIFATSLIGDLRILIFVYGLTLLFCYLSKIEILFFIKRVWLFIPIFAGIIAIPMTLNIFLAGDPLIQIIILRPGSTPWAVFVAREHLHHQTRHQRSCDIYHASGDMCIRSCPALSYHTAASSLQVPAHRWRSQNLCSHAGDGLQIHLPADGPGARDAYCQESQDY